MHWGNIISASEGYHDLCDRISSVHWEDFSIFVEHLKCTNDILHTNRDIPPVH